MPTNESLPNNKIPEPPKATNGLLLLTWVVLLGAVWLLGNNSLTGPSRETISYSVFRTALADGQLVSCEVGPAEIRGVLSSLVTADDGDNSSSSRPNGIAFRTVRVDDPTLLESLTQAGVETRGFKASPWPSMLSWGLPFLLVMVFWFWVIRRGVAGLGSAATPFGKSTAHLVSDEEVGVAFQDVAGCDEAKQELAEVVDFLQNPDRFTRMGAKIPKGVLLVGPPGTGKTLLARAVAGEAGVPFFSLSGSDFVEMFVGVGAARVRDLFKQAKEKAPCIIFIDELDAIGRTRGVRVSNVNDEREHTLNQLLVEMDGFDPNAGVILLSATNRPDVLDPALLRPGRFDRQVVLDSPDVEGRLAILKIHARGKPLEPSTDLGAVARATPGFSGADLANAMNEAALAAARQGETAISQNDLDAAVEKVVAGPERKSRRLDPKQKQRVAYHEAGHAVVAAHCDQADPVHKISIVPRGRAALGYTLQLPTGDQYLFTRSALYDRIRGFLGGRAAEEIIFDEVSTGAENDLETATNLARSIVGRFGMGESVRLLHCATPHGIATAQGLSEGIALRDCSEATAALLDQEAEQLLRELYREDRELLEKHRDQLERVARALIERETLDESEFRELLKPRFPSENDTRASTLPTPSGSSSQQGAGNEHTHGFTFSADEDC